MIAALFVACTPAIRAGTRSRNCPLHKFHQGHRQSFAHHRARSRSRQRVRPAPLRRSSSGRPAFLPANFRFNADQQWAYKTLFGFDAKTGSDAEIKNIIALELAARKEHGAGFYAWVMEKASLETAFANRTSMPPEMKAPQIRWVPYEDALLFPMNNAAAKAVNPDRRALFGMAEDLLHTYLRDAGFSAIPATLDSYVEKIVRATLQKQKSSGAVAVKFEAAYLQGPGFCAGVARRSITRICEICGWESNCIGKPHRGGIQNASGFFIQTDCTRSRQSSGWPCTFTPAADAANSSMIPARTRCCSRRMLNDPDLRKTNFVVLHGNPPKERSVSALIIKPNVYVDMSVLEFYWSPAELARILRPWLEVMPEHVMFGSDAGPFGPGLDWEETILIASRNARRALAIVLSDMVRDGTITQDRAKEIAQRVLRGNAEQLYGMN